MFDAIEAARCRGLDALRRLQKPDGSWRIPFESDPSPTALCLLMRRYLDRMPPAGTLEGMASYLLSTQSPDGGWPTWPGGPSVTDTTVLCHAALRVCGLPANDPHLVAARNAARRGGGFKGTWQTTRTALALLGQAPSCHLPYATVRLLPDRPTGTTWPAFMSIMALGAVAMMRLGRPEAVRPSAHPLLPDPARPGGAGMTSDAEAALRRHADQLFRAAPRGFRPGPMMRLFWAANRALDGRGICDRMADRVERWLLDRQEPDGTWGGYAFPTCLSLAALDQRRGLHGAAIDRGLEGLRDGETGDARGTWQSFTSAATHDTANALRTLSENGSGEDANPAARARDFLLEEGRRLDAKLRQRPHGLTPTGGWTFGLSSAGYPDCDMTAIVLWALLPQGPAAAGAVDAGLDWLLRMQGYDGGWAPFSRVAGPVADRVTRGLFAGYANASDADITARALRAIGAFSAAHPDTVRRAENAVRRGLGFLWKRRRPDGSWMAHWTAPFVYGTAEVLRTLAACGLPRTDARLRATSRWLLERQAADGSWGESKAGFEEDRFVPAPGHPGLTAVVVMGLLEAGLGADHPSILRALGYLLRAQRPDGLWDDPDWIGVIVPGCQYCHYGFSTSCHVLQALGQAGTGNNMGTGNFRGVEQRGR